MHWFTPRKARRILRESGFATVYDRWDLSTACGAGGIRGHIFDLIAPGAPTKLLADVMRRGCNYTAVK